MSCSLSCMQAEFDIMFGQGISREGDILDLAANVDIIVKSGSWYSYNGNKIGQGRENAKQFLKDNPQICQAVETQVRELFGLDADPASKTESDAAPAEEKKTK